MLNELQEYAEYTCDVSKQSTFRLMPEWFARIKKKNGKEEIKLMNGLSRAETVVARAALKEARYFETPLNAEERQDKIKEIIDALRQWCGFDAENAADSWLKSYYKKTIEGRPGMPSWEDVAKKRAKQYKISIVESVEMDAKSKSDTMLTSTYEKIVANAIYLGPLKRYYLVCKNGAEEALEYNGNPLTDPEKVDNALRLIAAYLLKQRLTGMTENHVNMTDLGYWAQNTSICDSKYYYSKKNGTEYVIKYKGAELYSKNTIKNNFSKIVINPGYLKDFDFKVVEEDAFHPSEAASQGYTFFADFGAGTRLQKEKQYDR